MNDKIVSGKIEIINHFDNLIQRVDIDIEESLEKYNDNQVIGDLKCYKTIEMMINRRRNKANYIADYRNKFNLDESSLNKSYENEHYWLRRAKQIEKDILLNRFNNENTEFNLIYKTVDLWSEETKVVDYLNQIRMRTIGGIEKSTKRGFRKL